MIPGGALIRLAAWYLVLIALILACFNVIVYFTLSQTLQARVAADLEAKSRLVMASLATSDAAVAPPQAVGDTAYGDTFVRVLQTTGKVPTIVLNAPKIDGLFDQDDNAVARAEVGLTTESQDTAGGQLYAIRTDPVKNKKGAVVGALQVARPISWIGDTLSRLERQLASDFSHKAPAETVERERERLAEQRERQQTLERRSATLARLRDTSQ